MAPHSNWLHSDSRPQASSTVPRVIRSAADPGAAKLALSVSEALKRALIAKFFATLDGEQKLRDDMRALCLEAQANGFQVETLIIAFKDAWQSSSEARTFPNGAQGHELLTRIITLCIAEYYSTSRAD